MTVAGLNSATTRQIDQSSVARLPSDFQSMQVSTVVDKLETSPKSPMTEFGTPGLSLFTRRQTLSVEQKSAIFRRVVRKIMAMRIFEKDSLKRLMEGREKTSHAGFHWYIEPYSAKYTVLRYSRAICIFSNFIIIPLM